MGGERLALMAEGRSNQAICQRLPQPQDRRGACAQHLHPPRPDRHPPTTTAASSPSWHFCGC